MFNENVSAELQEILAIELHRYKREIGRMTKKEWNLLIDWVYSGHSPYTNGDGIFDDDGWPLDFINTFRGWSNIREYSNQPGNDEVQTFSAIPDGDKFDDFPDDFFNATDLPF